MRVLLTTDTVGGVWTFTRELTAGLLARGHDSGAGELWAGAKCGAACVGAGGAG